MEKANGSEEETDWKKERKEKLDRGGGESVQGCSRQIKKENKENERAQREGRFMT